MSTTEPAAQRLDAMIRRVLFEESELEAAGSPPLLRLSGAVVVPAGAVVVQGLVRMFALPGAVPYVWFAEPDVSATP